MIKKLKLDDFELSYTSEGEGRDVLFLHGFPSNMFFWDDIKNDLKDKLRVTVVEQRGYPLSSIENSSQFYVDIQLANGIVRMHIDNKRLFVPTGITFIMWCIGASVILFSIAIIFLRGQVRPILRLSLIHI